MQNDDYSDGFGAGVFATIVLGLATYGTVKLIQEIRKSPEQKLLENLGKDLKQIDAGMNYGTPVEVQEVDHD